MNKLAEIISNYTSSQMPQFAIWLVEGILKNFKEWPKEVIEEFEIALVDLVEHKKQHDTESKKIQEELRWRNHRREYERHTNRFYDSRNESDFSPNG